MNSSFYDAWEAIKQKSRLAEEEKKKAAMVEKAEEDKLEDDTTDSKEALRKIVENERLQTAYVVQSLESSAIETKEEKQLEDATLLLKKVKVEKADSPREEESKMESDGESSEDTSAEETKEATMAIIKKERRDTQMPQVDFNANLKKTKKEKKSDDGAILPKKEVSQAKESPKKTEDASLLKKVKVEKTEGRRHGESFAAFFKRNGRSLNSISAEERKEESSGWDDTVGGFFNIRDFAIGRPIGKGRFGRVYAARDQVNEGYLIALKIIFKSTLVHADCEHLIMREIDVHAKLRHCNVLRFHSYFWDETKIYIVMEYALGGDLFNQMRKKRIDHETVAKYIYQLASGLKYCHEMEVIHRDIKPENLLIDAKGDLKIADFGWSVRSEKESKRTTFCGTLAYLAPELCRKLPYDNAVDRWAVGVLLFELLAGKEPFHDVNDRQVVNLIKKGSFYFPAAIPSGARDIISNLLKMNPAERMSLEKVMEHPWIQKYAKKRLEREAVAV